MITKNGEVYPWLNENAIGVIEGWDLAGWDVFEYGSGWSTLWWAGRCGKVISVEHEVDFYERHKEETDKFPNIDYRFRNLVKCEDCEYVQAINESDGMYDLVVIDGRNRVLCARDVVRHLKPAGRVIFDNTERVDYVDGIVLLDKELVDGRGYVKYQSPFDPAKRPSNVWWKTTIWMPK